MSLLSVHFQQQDKNMSNKQIKLLIFDLDGTLIDSVPDIAVATNAMLADLELPQFTESEIRHWVGNGSRKLIERALAHAKQMSKVDSAELNTAEQLFFQHYLQHCDEKTVPYQGVDKGLKALKQAGYTLALITNKPKQFIQPILQHFDWSSLFVMTLGGDSLAEKKPSPLPLQHVCQQLNVSVEQAMMIGDSKNDVLAGQNAGMPTIGLSYGYNYGQDIADFQPSFCFDTFGDMVGFLILSE